MRRMLSLAPLSISLTGQWLTASSQWCWYQASASYGWCCASATTKSLLVNDVVVMNTMESWWQRNSHYWTDWSRVKLSCLERCFITELMGECLQVRVCEQCNWSVRNQDCLGGEWVWWDCTASSCSCPGQGSLMQGISGRGRWPYCPTTQGPKVCWGGRKKLFYLC